MSSTPAPETTGRSLGPVLILVGALAVLLAQQIPSTSLGDNQDPGPRAFPVALGALLILGGAYELGLAAVQRKRSPAGPPGTPWLAELRARVGRRENRDVLILIGALALYLAALPWAGFAIATFLFSGGMMIRLGARWASALTVSAALILIIHVLFVMVFKVQLPPGVLGFSW